MTQSTITAGDATSSGITTLGGNDGTLILQTGPSGAKVNAMSLAADGTPTFIKPKSGTVLKAQFFTDVGSSTTSASIVNLNAATWNYTPVSTTSTLILIASGNMYTNAYAATSNYCFFYIGENTGSYVIRSSALALLNQQYSTTYAEFIQGALSIQCSLANTSLTTRQFVIMGNSWSSSVVSGVGPNTLTVLEVQN
jgi:hypothetical protein